MSFNEEISFDGTGNWHKQKHRNRNDLNKRQIGHNVLHDEDRSWGTLRPTRNLPSLFKKGDHVDNEGYIFSQGKVLGKYDRRIWNGSAWEYQDVVGKIGLQSVTTGEFFAYTNADGVAQKVPFGDSKYGYSVDIDGFVVPFNGSKYDVQDYFGAIDGDLRIIDPVTGTAITSSNAAETAASFREKSDPGASRLELFGLAKADTMRETRNNAYQYMRMTEAMSVSSEGYITVPFYVMGSSESDSPIQGISLPEEWTTFLAGSMQRAVSLDQSVMFVHDAANLATGNVPKVDMWGNLLLTSAATDASYNDVQLGTIVTFNHVVTTPYAKWVDTYPEMDITGTGTGGTDYDLYKLCKKIRTFRGDNTSISDIYGEITDTSGKYGWVTVYYRIGE